MVPIAIVAAVILLPIVYVVLTYNTLVALRNHIRDSWSNIDTELKRRYDLIPNLVATVKGYAAHEKELFEQVTQLRAKCMASRGAPQAQAADENMLVAALQRLLVVVENYPQLKADRHFRFRGADIVFGIHVDRPGPVFRGTGFVQQQVRPALDVDRVDRAVEELDIGRAVFLIDCHNLEQRTVRFAKPLAYHRVLRRHRTASSVNICPLYHL